MEPGALQLAKLLTVTALLGYSSWSDYRRREVSDWVWVVFLIASVCLNLDQILSAGTDHVGIVGAIVVHLALFAGLYFLGAFGGADAKSLVCLSAMYPIVPSFVPMLGARMTIVSVPVSSFANSILFSLIYVPLNVAENLRMMARGRASEDSAGIPLTKKLVAFFLLRRIKMSDLRRSQHAFHMVANSLREVSLRSMITSTPATIDEDVRGLEDRYVYVQALIPLQVFVLLGFLVTIVYGNILLGIPYALLARG